MNAFIAFSGVCFLIAITSGLIAVIFKIIIQGDFQLNEEWFQFKTSIKQLKSEWGAGKQRRIVFCKAMYLLFSSVGNTFFLVGFILMLAAYLKG